MADNYVMQTGSENGSQDNAAQSDDEDDAYWSQYDHYAGSGAGVNVPKDATRRDHDETAYYERYREVETAINGDTTTPSPAALDTPGTEPRSRGNEVNDAIADYVRATVRNLVQLANRCGMSQESFTEIISEEITNL